MGYGKGSKHWMIVRLKEGKVHEIKCTGCNRYLLRHTDSTTFEGSNCICHNNAEVIWPLGGDFRLVKIIAGDFNLIEVKEKDNEGI